MLNIVLLGGTGFVGSAILRNIHEKAGGDIRVRALVRGDAGRVTGPCVTACEGSLPDRIPADLFPEEPHVVVHVATKQIDTDGTGFFTANVEGTKKLLECLTPSTLGVIYGSSMSVYGQGEQANVTEEEPVKPDTKLARTRVMAENLILNDMRRSNKTGFVLRPRFILGKGDRYTLKGFRTMVGKGVVIGSGKQSYSIIDVDDYAEMIIRLARSVVRRHETHDPVCRPLNIGYREPVSLELILNEICKQDKMEFPIKTIPVIKAMHTFLRVLPVPAAGDFATKLELVGLSHSGNVKELEQEIGTDITAKKPLDVFRKILAESDSTNKKV